MAVTARAGDRAVAKIMAVEEGQKGKGSVLLARK